MECHACELNSLKKYKYVVIIAKLNDKWLLCKHKKRTTFETAGGHIELNETPLEAAKRELFEETGAVSYDIKPIFDYWAGDDDSTGYGMVFFAHIKKLGELPESEMERVECFDALPENLTYPAITPVLFKHFKDNF